MSATKNLVVTAAPFKSERDGHCYVIVRSGDAYNHIRLIGDDDPATVLCRLYGLKPAQAKRLLDAAAK